jgi:DNA-binding MurR/RpiR family transcriptional regulator
MLQPAILHRSTGRERGRMQLHQAVRQLDSVLSPAEQRALNLLLENPKETSQLAAAAVAERLGVHETTVLRLAKTLGYSGYRELREELVRLSLAQLSSTARAKSRPREAYTLSALVADEAAAMERVANSVPQPQIDQLAASILAAGTTYLFGPPYAEAVLTVLERRLRRFGLRAVALPHSGRLIAEHLAIMRTDDVVVSFVFRRPDPRLSRIIACANNVGAVTAVIADEAGLFIEPSPDQLIVAPRGPNQNQRSLMVPILMSYAIQFSIYHQAEHQSDRALRLIDDIARVVGDDEYSHGA